jgi:hypothetical protein
MQNRGASISAVIAGLDPAIHPFRKNFDAKKMDHRNSGVPEFRPFRWTQIGNIRFAVAKPAGDAAGRASTGIIRPDHALAAFERAAPGVTELVRRSPFYV